MLQPRDQRRKVESSPRGERSSGNYFEALTVFHNLKQNFPDVYRHILGIVKAFLKSR